MKKLLPLLLIIFVLTCLLPSRAQADESCCRSTLDQVAPFHLQKADKLFRSAYTNWIPWPNYCGEWYRNRNSYNRRYMEQTNIEKGQECYDISKFDIYILRLLLDGSIVVYQGRKMIKHLGYWAGNEAQ